MTHSPDEQPNFALTPTPHRQGARLALRVSNARALSRLRVVGWTEGHVVRFSVRHHLRPYLNCVRGCFAHVDVRDSVAGREAVDRFLFFAWAHSKRSVRPKSADEAQASSA